MLGKHASVKKRYIRGNQKNFMDKELNQAIMVTSKLRNNFLKLKTVEKRLANMLSSATDAKIAEAFNSFFGNTVNTLNIENDESIFCDTGDETDPLLRATKNITKIRTF